MKQALNSASNLDSNLDSNLISQDDITRWYNKMIKSLKVIKHSDSLGQGFAQHVYLKLHIKINWNRVKKQTKSIANLKPIGIQIIEIVWKLLKSIEVYWNPLKSIDDHVTLKYIEIRPIEIFRKLLKSIGI